MAKILPFKAVRPKRSVANLLASRPFSNLSSLLQKHRLADPHRAAGQGAHHAHGWRNREPAPSPPHEERGEREKRGRRLHRESS